MTSHQPVAAYAASYSHIVDARYDFGSFKQARHDDLIDGYDIALVERTPKGKLKITKQESAARTGGLIGLLAGVIVSVAIPPALLVEAAGGAVAGGLIGHWSRGMSHKQAAAFGDTLQAGQASIVLVVYKADADVASLFARADSIVEEAFDPSTGAFAAAADDGTTTVAAAAADGTTSTLTVDDATGAAIATSDDGATTTVAALNPDGTLAAAAAATPDPVGAGTRT